MPGPSMPGVVVAPLCGIGVFQAVSWPPAIVGAAPLMPPGWRPHEGRCIRLWDFAARAPSGRRATALPSRWPPKPASALLDYSIDAGELLQGPNDRLMLTVNGAGGLTFGASTVVGCAAVVWLSGGAPGMDYAIDLTLTTAYGRAARRIVRLAVTS